MCPKRTPDGNWKIEQMNRNEKNIILDRDLELEHIKPSNL